MSKESWRYTASMLKDLVEIKRHRCHIIDGIVWERITTGELKGLTGPITGTYRTEAEAVKRLKKYLIGQRGHIRNKLARLDRQIPACERYLSC